MSIALRDGVSRLEVTTRVTLGVLALASGVYTYLGVRDLLNGDATVVFFAAVIYSVAVSVGIYAFWTFLMRFLPHVQDQKSRSLLFACMALGSLMIIAMSAWLNASALAGAAAIQQHLSVTVQAYTRDLDRAHNNALAAQSLLPDIQMAATRFSTLADAERNGSLTGTSGSGTVVQLLTQMSNQLGTLGQEVAGSADKVKVLFDQGSANLEKMRGLVSDRGPINARSDAFGKEAMSLMGVIAKLQQTSVAPAVKRAADGLVPALSRLRPMGAAIWRTARRPWSAKCKPRWRRRLPRCRKPPRKSWIPLRWNRRVFSRCRRLKRSALCRRFSAELGRRHLNRSDAGGFGLHPVHRAGRHPARE